MTVADGGMLADWENARRAEAWAGELRVNLIRMIGIVLFYGRHLIDVLTSEPGSSLRGTYHAQITWVVLLWSAITVVLHVRLSRRQVEPALKYVTVAWDAMMITLLCMISGGPLTPLVLLYFLLIASAPLRLSIRAVYLATGAAICGYLSLLGFYIWYVVGFEKYYATPELRIPRAHELIVILAMVVAGLFAGQYVRQARRLVQRQPVTLLASPTTPDAPPTTTTAGEG